MIYDDYTNYYEKVYIVSQIRKLQACNNKGQERTDNYTTKENHFSELVNTLKQIMKFNSVNKKSAMQFFYEKHQQELKDLKNNPTEEAQMLYFQIMPYIPHDENHHVNVSDNINIKLFPNGFIADLYILAGFPGSGKTSLACMFTACTISGNNKNLKTNKNYRSRPVIYVTLEQEKIQIKMRIASSLSALNELSNAVSYSDLLSGNGWKNPNGTDLAMSLFKTYSRQLQIISCKDIGSLPKIDKLLHEIREAAKNFDEKPVVIIDQFSNISGAKDYSDDAVVLALKSFATNEGFTVILQAQFSKSAIESATKKDGTIDYKKITGNGLLGTSALNQQSIGTMILVPEIAKKEEEGHSAKMVTLKVDKSRYGITDTNRMWFFGDVGIFTDYAENRGRKKIEENEN